MITGLRMNHAYVRPGGVAQDLPEGGVDQIREFLEQLPERLHGRTSDCSTTTASGRTAPQGIGYLDLAGCMALGITGPVLRADRPAAGPAQVAALLRLRDVRLRRPDPDTLRRLRPLPGPARGDEPSRSRSCSSALDRLEPARSWSTTRRSPGPRSWPSAATAWATRLEHIRHIMGESMEALIHHFKLVTEGFPVPAGQVYSPIESPRGELGVHVVSDGGTRPYRVHFRDPSFTNLQATAAMCEGGQVADVIAAVASIDPVMGGVDRSTCDDLLPDPQRPTGHATGETRRCHWSRSQTRAATWTRGDHRRYPQAASALLPMLHLVQSERGLRDPRRHRALRRGRSASPRPRSPRSRPSTPSTSGSRSATYHVGVCTNTLCAVLGGDAIWSALTSTSGVGHDEATADGRSPSSASSATPPATTRPVMTVNWEFFDNMDAGVGARLVDGLRAGDDVVSTRGPRSCTFEEISRVLAGFDDGRAGEGGKAGPATLAGTRLSAAGAHGETTPRRPSVQSQTASGRRRRLNARGRPARAGPTPLAPQPPILDRRRREDADSPLTPSEAAGTAPSWTRGLRRRRLPGCAPRAMTPTTSSRSSRTPACAAAAARASPPA